MWLLELPTEILISIFLLIKMSHSLWPDIQSILNARLVSRRCYEIGSLFLFDSFQVKMTSKQISTLGELSTHPIFCRTMKEVKINLSKYDNLTLEARSRTIPILQLLLEKLKILSKKYRDEVTAKTSGWIEIGAAIAKLSNLESIIVLDCGDKSPSDPSILQATQGINEISKVCQRVTSASVALYWSEQSAQYAKLASGHLRALLSAIYSITTIQDLTLHSFLPRPFQIFDPPLSRLIPDQSLPNLLSISLTSVFVGQQDFKTLVNRQKSKLKRLSFDRVAICDGEWKESIEILRGLQGLERAEVIFPLGGEFGNTSGMPTWMFRKYRSNEVEEFILGKLNDNPLRVWFP